MVNFQRRRKRLYPTQSIKILNIDVVNFRGITIKYVLRTTDKGHSSRLSRGMTPPVSNQKLPRIPGHRTLPPAIGLMKVPAHSDNAVLASPTSSTEIAGRSGSSLREF